ncbi:hypothetical protein C5167_000860 [Papaver somniferum]|uniref:Uncharacterized protein n=1 Tax=Papaver somniferum TaxID=3469 RepID=A0A4Y7KTS2_PAPSO|nr:hypothetical protein C5167_000860 [Papaver somniferum]
MASDVMIISTKATRRSQRNDQTMPKSSKSGKNQQARRGSPKTNQTQPQNERRGLESTMKDGRSRGLISNRDSGTSGRYGYMAGDQEKPNRKRAQVPTQFVNDLQEVEKLQVHKLTERAQLIWVIVLAIELPLNPLAENRHSQRRNNPSRAACNFLV